MPTPPRDFYEQVRRLTITALFSDDVLFSQLVLKGGNAIALVHDIGQRASLDLDFSLAGDFVDVADAERRARLALEKRFDGAGYTVFDFALRPRPVLDGPDQRPWWGGYEIVFKLLKTDDYRRLHGRPNKRAIEAVPIADGQQRVLRVDISKHEFVEGRVERDLDHYTIRVYTPTMVAAEKLRALCQQMPAYILRAERTGRPRARDFYDIYVAVTEAHVALAHPDTLDLIRQMFAAKQVPLALLAQLNAQREFHRPDWPSVVAAVPHALQPYDVYVDFVVAQVAALQTLWDV